MKSVNLFLIPNQIVEEENNIVDDTYNTVANLPLLVIDWNKEEVTALDILTQPIENRMR